MSRKVQVPMLNGGIRDSRPVNGVSRQSKVGHNTTAGDQSIAGSLWQFAAALNELHPFTGEALLTTSNAKETAA